MVNRYADEAEANSFQRAEERTAEGGSRWGGYLASRHNRDRADYRHDETTELIML